MSRLIDGPIAVEMNVDAVLENGGEPTADEVIELPIDGSAWSTVAGLVLTLVLFGAGVFYGLAG